MGGGGGGVADDSWSVGGGGKLWVPAAGQWGEARQTGRRLQEKGEEGFTTDTREKQNTGGVQKGFEALFES